MRRGGGARASRARRARRGARARPAVRDLVAALDDHVATLGPARLEDALGGRVAELARVLPSAVAAGDIPLGGLQDERFRTYRAMRELLARLAEQRPVVLVLDDVHWADDASLELIAHLLRRPPAARILTALAFRTGGVPPEVRAALEAAAREGGVTELQLTAMARGDADLLMGAGLATPVRDEIYRHSGGNPFYMQRLAWARRRRPPAAGGGTGRRRAERRRRRPRAGAAGPERARAGARLGAAVVGDPADLELAATAAGLARDDALTAIDELVDRDVLRPTDAARRYAFRHPIVRRTVYEGAGGRGASPPTRERPPRSRSSPAPWPRRPTTSSARRFPATPRPPTCSSRPAHRPRRARPR